MHTFRRGDLKDLTVEQAMLRKAPRLYEVMDWARKNNIPELRNAVRDFDNLRQNLLRAPVTAHCAQQGCQRTPFSMTFPLDKEGWCLASPYFWCDEHSTLEKRGISQKYKIHFDVISLMKTDVEKESIFKQLKLVFGIQLKKRISVEFAHRFFAELG
jgi:hypothetical protein